MVGSEEALLPVTPSEARSPAPAGQKHCQVLTREGRAVSDPPTPARGYTLSTAVAFLSSCLLGGEALGEPAPGGDPAVGTGGGTAASAC